MMKIWVVKWYCGDCNRVIVATENINMAIYSLIEDANGCFGDYILQCWENGYAAEVEIKTDDLCWNRDDIDRAESFRKIKEKCKMEFMEVD